MSVFRTRSPSPRAIACTCAALLMLAAVAPAWALTKEEIITLVGLDIPDDQIIKKMQKDGTVYDPTPADILEMKKKGVSDKILRYMVSTKSAKAAGTLPAAAPPKKEEKKRELTAAEQVAEEAKLKEESARLLREQQEREERQRNAFADRVLKAGQELANQGEWVKAIQVFTKFVQEGVGGIPYAPDSDQAYTAMYGMANALARAGLHQSAAKLLLDVVRAGPEKVFFIPAFNQLRELRRKINYRPPELEDLTRFSVVNADPQFQSGFYYFVGEFLHDFGLSSDAKPYLEKVGKNYQDFGRAQYLLGLVAFQDESLTTQQKVADSSRAFQEAVLAGEKQLDGQPIVDLGFLALARLAYEYQQYDAAIYYYRKISKNSPKLASAFYEAGWTYFLKGDLSRALGTFHALHSPYFAHHFYPEMWILEAALYVNTCHVEPAEKAMKMFEEHILVLAPPLRDFLKRNRRPEDFYGALIDSVNSRSAASLPRKLASPVLEDVEFYNLYQTIKQIEREEAQVKQNLQALGTFGQDLLARLGQLRAERISEAGVVVQKKMRAVQKDLETYQDKLDQLRIDLEEARLMALDEEMLKANRAKKDAQQSAATKQGNIALAGSDSMVWPFEGEFWKDEIGAYRSFLTNMCREEEAEAGPEIAPESSDKPAESTPAPEGQ
jgi:tetratricopeptide (TPR) repeat protein